MEKYDIYHDITSRTGGDIFIGVVGPVRTGKSTFISKFMENFVLPSISNKLQKQIATDEMPQSASGKTIMTTQPKFIPANSVKVQFKNKCSANVRLVDCVGYLIEGVSGHIEDEKERLVKTPWDDKEIPFEKAAEIGTKKVITDYSTVGILVTTDGSFTDIPRKNYIPAEERAVKELKELNKPFIVIMNTTKPNDNETIKLCLELEEKYGVSVLAFDVNSMTANEINFIIEKILLEFPMCSFDVSIPKWMQALPINNPIIENMIDNVKVLSKDMLKMRDFNVITDGFKESEIIDNVDVIELKLGSGVPQFKLTPKNDLYYKILSNECGEDIIDEYDLIRYIKSFSTDKRRYEKIKNAFDCAEESGYGVVFPTVDEMLLEEPILVKQGGGFGVKLKASAPSFHVMKVDVSTEVAPIVGSEKQGEDMVNYIMDNFENNPSDIWQTNMLGKPLSDLVNEGLNGKLNNMPKEAQGKMRKTLTRIVNENKGGIICILL